MRSGAFARVRVALVTTAALALLVPVAHASPDDVPKPTVEGPISNASSRPYFSTDIDLAALGYVEEEFFFSGTARQYTPGSGAEGESLPYKTRMVVRRPVSREDFNGVVVVEMYNTTAGHDQEFEWFVSHEHFTREGYVWIGVTAQPAGANSLRNFNSSRYGSMSIPDENQAFDIFSQAARSLTAREGVDPMGGLGVPKVFIASGHSQSTIKLADYHNYIQPQHGLFGGYMLRGSQSVHVPVPGVKMFRSYSESDKYPQGDIDNLEDSEDYMIWEHAGTAHVSYKEAIESGYLNVRDRGSTTPAQCTKPRYTRPPFNHAHNAAYHHLVRWIKGEGRPPSAPRFEFDPAGRKPLRDADGFVIGGVRTPEMQVPRALDTGENTGAGLCWLYGSHEPYSQEKLLTLYPTRADYVGKMNAALRKFFEDGYILAADAQVTCERARRADFAWKGAAGDLPVNLKPCPVPAPTAGTGSGGTGVSLPTGYEAPKITASVTVKGAQRLRRSTTLRKGVPVVADCAVRCTVRVSLEADPRTLKRTRLTNPIGRATMKTFTGRRSVPVRFSAKERKALTRARAKSLTLRAFITDTQERVAVRTVQLRLR